MTTRVAKPKKPDRLFESTLASDIVRGRIQSMLWDYDRELASVEKHWGVDRLPYLVGHETRTRWWRAADALNAAVEANDADRVEALVANMRRGLVRLAEEAQANGQAPLSPDTIETPLPDGKVLRIVRTWPEHADRVEKDPHVVTWTVEEVARVVAAYSPVNAVKDAFPGATVTEARSQLSKELNDDIPF